MAEAEFWLNRPLKPAHQRWLKRCWGDWQTLGYPPDYEIDVLIADRLRFLSSGAPCSPGGTMLSNRSRTIDNSEYVSFEVEGHKLTITVWDPTIPKMHFLESLRHLVLLCLRPQGYYLCGVFELLVTVELKDAHGDLHLFRDAAKVVARFSQLGIYLHYRATICRVGKIQTKEPTIDVSTYPLVFICDIPSGDDCGEP